MEIAVVIIALCAVAVAGYAFGERSARKKVSAELAAARSEATAAAARLDAERSHALEAARMQSEALRREFRAMTAETVRAESEQLRAEHVGRLNDLLAPLGKNIESFREQFIARHADTERYIRDLMEKAVSVGQEAEELARALKGNNKMQGNWGEAVLNNLLEVSGLTEGRDFFVQERVKDERGRDLIPDVVVCFPGGRNVVIDSKVSLTAFADYANAEDDNARSEALKRHVASVRAHVKELSAKNYAATVKNAIGYVLMFVPNEAAYVAAVGSDDRLAADAYRARVILLNPTNLLMALQLAYNLWQSEMQSRSVKEIYESADRLYKKFCGFADNFMKIGKGVEQLSQAYVRAEKQLCSGRGNIVSQLEGWKKKGLTPSAELPEALRREAEAADDALLPEAAGEQAARGGDLPARADERPARQD